MDRLRSEPIKHGATCGAPPRLARRGALLLLSAMLPTLSRLVRRHLARLS
ncbi:MAG: hypothetical protein Q8K55_11310 [Gemmatimonadaceae bacterium]|nr:hypothetical protein [Gemmatimonadaceae bacterium]